MKNLRFKNLLLGIIILSSFLFSSTIMAAFELEGQYPTVGAGDNVWVIGSGDPVCSGDGTEQRKIGTNGEKLPYCANTLPGLIMYLYFFALYVGAMATFVMLVVGGVQWVSSAGSPDKYSRAKSRVISALVGLLLLFSSYIFFSIINPELLNIGKIGSDLHWLDSSDFNFGGDMARTSARNTYESTALECECDGTKDPKCGGHCHNTAPDSKSGRFDDIKEGSNSFGVLSGCRKGSGTDIHWCTHIKSPYLTDVMILSDCEPIDLDYWRENNDDIGSETVKTDCKEFKASKGETFGKNDTGFILNRDQTDKCDGDEHGGMCAMHCFEACKDFYGETASFGVIANDGNGEIHCSCFHADPKLNAIDIYHMEKEVCDGNGSGFPPCGDYCYDFCDDMGYMLGTVAKPYTEGGGLDKVDCACMTRIEWYPVFTGVENATPNKRCFPSGAVLPVGTIGPYTSEKGNELEAQETRCENGANGIARIIGEINSSEPNFEGCYSNLQIECKEGGKTPCACTDLTIKNPRLGSGFPFMGNILEAGWTWKASNWNINAPRYEGDEY